MDIVERQRLADHDNRRERQHERDHRVHGGREYRRRARRTRAHRRAKLRRDAGCRTCSAAADTKPNAHAALCAVADAKSVTNADAKPHFADAGTRAATCP